MRRWGLILLGSVAACVELAPRTPRPDVTDGALSDQVDDLPSVEVVAPPDDGPAADSTVGDAPPADLTPPSDAPGDATADARDAPDAGALSDAPPVDAPVDIVPIDAPFDIAPIDVTDASLPADATDGAITPDDIQDAPHAADAPMDHPDAGGVPDVLDGAVDAEGFDAREAGVAIATPRWPPSGAPCTSRRPTLRWPLQAADEGARVELCEDRGCSRVVSTLRGLDRATPAADLPMGHVFWRVIPLRGGVDQAASPTWFFVVPRGSAPTATAHGRVLDFDADGRADVCAGSELESLVRAGSGSARLYLRDATGALGASPFVTFSQLSTNSGTRVGTSMTAGDFDGDGLIDLVVGARSEQTTSGAVGHVRVYRGTTGAPPSDAATSTLIQGTVSAEGVGQQVAVAGDVNRDGYDDLLVTSNLTSATEGGMPTGGRVRLYLGARAGLSSSATQQFVGTGVEQLGASIDGDGDLDGDGHPDIAVGVPGAAPGSRTNAGRVQVYLGSPAGLPSAASVTLDGPEAGERFGSHLRVSGDLNGDGFTDLVVGAPLATVGGVANAGRVYVYFGSASFPSAPAGLTNPTVLADGGAGSSFGWRLLTSVDVNGDGLRDVLVGAPGHNGAGERVGSVFVYLGSATRGVEVSPFARVNGVSCGDDFGRGLSNQGDINRDGYGDFVVSATRAASGRTSWVMCPGDFGPAHGAVYSFEGGASELRFREGDTRFGPMGAWFGLQLLAGLPGRSNVL